MMMKTSILFAAPKTLPSCCGTISSRGNFHSLCMLGICSCPLPAEDDQRWPLLLQEMGVMSRRDQKWTAAAPSYQGQGTVCHREGL